MAGGSSTNAPLDYIHRRDGETEIYFVANQQATTLQADCLFRVKGKAPELWDAVTYIVDVIDVTSVNKLFPQGHNHSGQRGGGGTAGQGNNASAPASK